jgi:hypothetical protein
MSPCPVNGWSNLKQLVELRIILVQLATQSDIASDWPACTAIHNGNGSGDDHDRLGAVGSDEPCSLYAYLKMSSKWPIKEGLESNAQKRGPFDEALGSTQ